MWDKRHGVPSPEGPGDDNHVDILLEKKKQCFRRDVSVGKKQKRGFHEATRIERDTKLLNV